MDCHSVHVGISIHAPRVGSDHSWERMATALFISIHAPRVGSDRQSGLDFEENRDFNPRSPCGERPIVLAIGTISRIFQSTLPVWGATTGCTKLCTSTMDFNPRSPCGERLAFCQLLTSWKVFQSTLPVWGATAKMHRFFFCIFGEKGIICNILQIGGLSAGNLLKTVGCFLSKSGANPPEKLWVLGVRV